MPGIEITGLRFSFGGPAVLKGVDLRVDQGSLVTIFGPNGTGKTTLLKILAGLLRPSKGTVFIAGVDATRAPNSLRRLIGMISHQPYLYPQLTGRENLEFYARR
jgi:ABC-type multidrug transport system ATPase subunit